MSTTTLAALILALSVTLVAVLPIPRKFKVVLAGILTWVAVTNILIASWTP